MQVPKNGGVTGQISSPTLGPPVRLERSTTPPPRPRPQLTPALPPRARGVDPRPTRDLGHGGSPLSQSPMFLRVARPRSPSAPAVMTQSAQPARPTWHVPLVLHTDMPLGLQQLVTRTQPLLDHQLSARQRLAEIGPRLSELSRLDEPSGPQQRELNGLLAEYEQLNPRTSDVCHRSAESVCEALGGRLDAPLRSARRDEGGAAFGALLADNARDGQPHLYLLRATYDGERYNGHSWAVLQQGDTLVTLQSNAGEHTLQEWATGRVQPRDRDGVAASARFGGLTPVSTDDYTRALQGALLDHDLRGVTGCPRNGDVLFGFEEHRVGRPPRDPCAILSQSTRDRFDGWAHG